MVQQQMQASGGLAASKPLNFDDFDDVRRHLHALQEAQVTTTGGWTAGQICYHLAAAFEASSEPASNGGRRPSRWRSFPKRFLALRGRFPKGMPIPPQVRERLTPPSGAEFSSELARLRRAIDMFEQATGPPPIHPVLGALTRDEWRRFHLRHCELHLKFICKAD